MSARAWMTFAGVATLWGLPYLFIKIAVDDGISPAFLAWSRVVLGAAVLLVLAWRAGTLPTLRGHGRWLLAYAAAEIVVPFPLIAAGEQRVSSSTAAILIATAPLIVALLAIRFDREEKATGLRLAGLMIGLSGVIALVGIDVAGNAGELIGVGLIIIAALGYAIGPMVLKRKLGGLDPTAAMAGGLSIAAVLLTPPALLSAPTTMPPTSALVSVAILGFACTAAAFSLMARLVFDIGPSRALVVTYVNPAIAVALGIAFLNESVGAGAVAGMLLILAGSWLSTDGRLPPGLMRLTQRFNAVTPSIDRGVRKLIGRWNAPGRGLDPGRPDHVG